MDAPEFWAAQSLLDVFAPRLARLHGYKMSPQGLAVFCDWLEERGDPESLRVLEWCRRVPEAFSPDPFLSLVQSSERFSCFSFPCLTRISEWVIGWTQPLLFDQCRVMAGPIADAYVGCDSWAEYRTSFDAEQALCKWGGYSTPPPAGLIRYQLRNGKIEKGGSP